MKNRSIVQSFRCAINGIRIAFKGERNLRVHLIIAIYALFLSIVCRFDAVEISVLILVCSLVITSELINTAIEETVDIEVSGYDRMAKAAKDISAGAVMVSAVSAIITGAVLFLNDFRIVAGIKLIYSNAAVGVIFSLSVVATAVGIIRDCGRKRGN